MAAGGLCRDGCGRRTQTGKDGRCCQCARRHVGIPRRYGLRPQAERLAAQAEYLARQRARRAAAPLLLPRPAGRIMRLRGIDYEVVWDGAR